MSNVNPLDNPEAFYTMKLGGVPLPGVIPPKGISGWSIKTDYDVKKGKGADDATETDTGDPPPEGKVKYQLWRNGTNDLGEDDPTVPNDFDDDENFVLMLRAARRNKSALDIVNPIINQCEVRAVVVKEIGQITDEGAGLWTRELELLKWVPSPKDDAGGTPSGTFADENKNLFHHDPDSEGVVVPTNPNAAREQALIDKTQEAKSAPDQ